MIRLFSTRAAGVACRALARTAGVRRPDVSWRLVTPLTFDNSVAVLDLDERRAQVTIRRSAPEGDDGWPLETLHERRPRRPPPQRPGGAGGPSSDARPANPGGQAEGRCRCRSGGARRSRRPSGSTSMRSLRTFLRSPPSISYGTLRSSLMRTECALRGERVRRLARRADDGPRDRSGPFPDAVGRDDAELEHAVVRGARPRTPRRRRRACRRCRAGCSSPRRRTSARRRRRSWRGTASPAGASRPSRRRRAGRSDPSGRRRRRRSCARRSRRRPSRRSARR